VFVSYEQASSLSSVRIAHKLVECSWKFFHLYYIQVLCQYRLCKVDHVGQSAKFLLVFASTVIPGFSLLEIHGQDSYSLLDMYVFRNWVSSLTRYSLCTDPTKKHRSSDDVGDVINTYSIAAALSA
jgi:hypothetical protein